MQDQVKTRCVVDIGDALAAEFKWNRTIIRVRRAVPGSGDGVGGILARHLHDGREADCRARFAAFGAISAGASVLYWA